jgi:hypothetical protein
MVAIALIGSAACGGGDSKDSVSIPEPGKSEILLETANGSPTDLSSFAVADDGTVYAVVKQDGKRVVISVRRKGESRTVSSTPADPSAVATGRGGVLFVAGSGEVVRIEADGKANRIGSTVPVEGAPPEAPGLREVRDIAVDPRTSDLYLSDRTKIDRLDPGGTLTTVAGVRAEPGYGHSETQPRPTTQVHFGAIHGLAFEPASGALFANSDVLLKIEPNGNTAPVRIGDRPVTVETFVVDERFGGLIAETGCTNLGELSLLKVDQFSALARALFNNIRSVDKGGEVGIGFDASGNYYEGQVESRAVATSNAGATVIFTVGKQDPIASDFTGRCE